MSDAGIEGRFTHIFKTNAWRCDESVSGPSSTLARTQTLRAALPALFESHGIRSVLDAPCGDFNWMRHVVEGAGLRYTGADIVQDLVRRNAEDFAHLDNVGFVHLDLTRDTLPQADLLLCRDCLFHLSYEDTERALANFLDSGIPYLLTTTHLNRNGFSNRDIASGDWRWMDLFEAPYCFPREVSWRVVDGGGDREMCLWSRDQVPRRLQP